MTPNLTPDELLSTTRAVRKRLDLTRPVPRELIEECVDLAVQAPTGSSTACAIWRRTSTACPRSSSPAWKGAPTAPR